MPCSKATPAELGLSRSSYQPVLESVCRKLDRVLKLADVRG